MEVGEGEGYCDEGLFLCLCESGASFFCVHNNLQIQSNKDDLSYISLQSSFWLCYANKPTHNITPLHESSKSSEWSRSAVHIQNYSAQTNIGVWGRMVPLFAFCIFWLPLLFNLPTVFISYFSAYLTIRRTVHANPLKIRTRVETKCISPFSTTMQIS